MVADTLENLLSVVVHAANIHDTKSGIPAAERAYAKYPSLQILCADAGYRGTFAAQLCSNVYEDNFLHHSYKNHIYNGSGQYAAYCVLFPYLKYCGNYNPDTGWQPVH